MPNQQSPQSKQLVLPDTFIPEYLSDYLTSLDIPDPLTKTFLMRVGQEAYRAKLMDIETHNMTYPKSKKRVPQTLEFTDVAIIFMSLFEFRNIQMTNRPGDTILGIYLDGSLGTPDNKIGTYSTDKKIMYAVLERIAPDFRTRDMDDVLEKIERSVTTVEQTKDKHLFIVNNGIYDQKEKQLLPFSPNYVYMTKIPVDYVENPQNPVIVDPKDGYSWDVESWILDIVDHEREAAMLIWQVIADCLQPHHSRHKSVWFYSEKGNNGKGTVGQLIKNLLGVGNYASLSVADFNHEFLKETLIGVAANISDENDVEVYIDSIKDYKASVTGDDININRKYEKPLRIQFHGANIQMMNGLPKTKDKSDSFYRRIILVPFLKSFTNNGERKYIKDDYINRTEVLEYVLNKAVNMEFTEYIVPPSSARVMDNYKERNNPVLEFWNELKDEFVWDLLPTTFLYDLYQKWFEINNPSGKIVSRGSFIDTLRTIIQTTGDEWEDFTGQNQKKASAGLMDGDEPLITEYGMHLPERNGNPSQWCNAPYKGSDLIIVRDFQRRAYYRGFVRR